MRVRASCFIGHYSAEIRWGRPREESKLAGKPRANGRPQIKESVIEVILRMVQESRCGYWRIYAKLWKLAVGKISPTTIKNIPITHGFVHALSGRVARAPISSSAMPETL